MTRNSLDPASYEKVPIIECAAGSAVEYLPFVKWREVRTPSWAKEHDRFVLAQICGDSLLGYPNFPVKHGDYALIHLTGDVREGDLAAVLTPQGMMIKFLHNQTGGMLRLESANPDYAAVYYDASEVQIQGRVVRLEHDL
jgi:phage repressor protein C with HTH and peptisase S24 domain